MLYPQVEEESASASLEVQCCTKANQRQALAAAEVRWGRPLNWASQAPMSNLAEDCRSQKQPFPEVSHVHNSSEPALRTREGLRAADPHSAVLLQMEDFTNGRQDPPAAKGLLLALFQYLIHYGGPEWEPQHLRYACKGVQDEGHTCYKLIRVNSETVEKRNNRNCCSSHTPYVVARHYVKSSL